MSRISERYLCYQLDYKAPPLKPMKNSLEIKFQIGLRTALVYSKQIAWNNFMLWSEFYFWIYVSQFTLIYLFPLFCHSFSSIDYKY